MKSLGGDRGAGMVDLIVTVGLVAVLLAVAVWSLDRPSLDLEQAFNTLGNDLREARMEATLRGAHFRVSAAGDAYLIERLQDENGDRIWTPDSSYEERRVSLPAGIVVAATAIDGSATAAEFDSRGVLVDPAGGEPGVVQYTLTSNDGTTRRVSAWPSGQVRQDRAGEKSE
jgi:Tfp pilus assembly protein FimT